MNNVTQYAHYIHILFRHYKYNVVYALHITIYVFDTFSFNCQLDSKIKFLLKNGLDSVDLVK